MIQRKLFQKYFFLASVLMLVFVFLGFFLVSFLMEAMHPYREFPPPLHFARIIDKLNAQDKVAALKEFSSWGDQFLAPHLTLYNENGQVLFPEHGASILNWEKIEKPVSNYDFINIPSDVPQGRRLPLPFGPPGPPRGTPGALVKLSGSPNYYLLISPPTLPSLKTGPGPLFPFIGIGSLILSLLLGVGTTIAIIYHQVRNGVQQADKVIAELHKGNLKARFDIRRNDEFGRAMKRFNFMADEIEKLVNDLKKVDQKRTQLLQELAHDLRTPIASLKNLNETLEYKRASLTPEVQDELLGLARKEINYFERLVEDLLLLAQVNEPLYQVNRPPIELMPLISEVAEDCILRYEHQGKKVRLIQEFPETPIEISGDSFLIGRLFRNAFENAAMFAKSTISISIAKVSESIHICIEDDGPGFSHEALHDFGNRRVSRKLENKPDGKLSVGLGSVVMRTVCEAHRGRIVALNRTNGNTVLGAKVEIQLPLR